jgi:hypothetical protein
MEQVGCAVKSVVAETKAGSMLRDICEALEVQRAMVGISETKKASDLLVHGGILVILVDLGLDVVSEGLNGRRADDDRSCGKADRLRDALVKMAKKKDGCRQPPSCEDGLLPAETPDMQAPGREVVSAMSNGLLLILGEVPHIDDKCVLDEAAIADLAQHSLDVILNGHQGATTSICNSG